MPAVCNYKRTFFPYGFECSYTLTLNMDMLMLSKLVSITLEQLLPQLAFQGGDLRDLKGREPQDILEPSAPATARPRGHELFYLEGGVFLGETKHELNPKRQPHEPFCISLLTPFAAFEGSMHIQHHSEVRREGALPAELPLSDLGKIFPIFLTRVRFGLEFFRASRISSLVGVMPTVLESLLFDATDSTLQLAIISQGLKSRGATPLASGNFFEKLRSAMLYATGHDLAPDFRP